MSVLFLSDCDDHIIRAAYEYLSKQYDGCEYATSDSSVNAFDPSIIITNHCINHIVGKKVIYYATSDNGLNLDIGTRRIMTAWLKECSDIICSSMSLAKMFYDNFRIQPSVQHPVISEQKPNQSNIVYSNSFIGLDVLRDELRGENFVPLNSPYDVANAKIYLQSSSSFLDLGMCVASACGVPVIAEYNLNLKEFLENGDVLIMPDTPNFQKIQIIKKTLKECARLKTPSRRFLQTPVLEDKIKQALAKKPTTRTLTPTTPPVIAHRTVGGRRSGVIQAAPQPQMLTAIPPLQNSTIYITGIVVGISGYDNMVFEIIKGLKSINVDVRINATGNIDYNIVPSYFKDIHLPRPHDAWEIIITPPCNFDRISPTKKSILFTMWETDKLEPHWVKQMNLASFVIVPSEWAIESFKKSGITIPIYKVPLGYSPLIFNPTAYPTECIFGTAAALTAGGLRKNTKHVIGLFQKAFPNDENVKLKIKITPTCPWQDCNDPRVYVTRKYLPPLELAEWYRSISAFVNCSYAEGFGLHLIEAMACGRPVISAAYSAVTEYFDDSVGYVVDHHIIPASGGPYTGYWGKPDDDGIITQMQHIYQNQIEAKTKGEASFLRAKNFTWKEAGKKLISLLNEKGVVQL